MESKNKQIKKEEKVVEETGGKGDGYDGDDDEEVGGTIQFKRKDGVEKDGYICFPVPQEEEEEEIEEPVVEVQQDFEMSTCPEDPRFQQTNKTRWCYRMYVDYHACRNLLGRSANQCNFFYKCYNSICPNGWIEKWDEQREAANFPCDPTKGCPNLNEKCEAQKPCP